MDARKSNNVTPATTPRLGNTGTQNQFGYYINRENESLPIDDLLTNHLNTTSDSSKFIFEIYEYYAKCFNSPAGTQKDKNSIEQKNENVIKFFCEYPMQISSTAACFFHPVLSKHIDNILSDILNSNSDNREHKVKRAKKTFDVINNLLEAIKNYTTHPKANFKTNAQTLNGALSGIHTEILNEIEKKLEDKINHLEKEADSLAQPQATLNAQDYINNRLKHINSITNFLEQLKGVKDAQLISKDVFQQFSKFLQLIRKHSNESLNNFYEKMQTRRDNELASLKLKATAISTISMADAHKKLEEDVTSIHQQIIDSTLENYNNLENTCNLLHAEIVQLKSTYQTSFSEKNSALNTLFKTEPEAIHSPAIHEDTDAFDRLAKLNKEHSYVLSQAFHDSQAQLKINYAELIKKSDQKLDELKQLIIIIKQLRHAKMLATGNNEPALQENADNNEQSYKTELERLEKELKEATDKNLSLAYRNQFERLEKNLKEATDNNLSLLQTLHDECISVKNKGAGEATLAKLAHTLNIANTFVESPNDRKDYDSLFTEGQQYINTNQKSFRAIGGCLIGLGCVCLLAAVAIGIATFGIGLLPLTAIIAGSIIGALGLVGSSTVTIGAISLHKAKHPPIHDALLNAAVLKPAITLVSPS